MKSNEFVCISGASTRLAPYCHRHVQKYHSWMKSQELQELTASEPLSLDQEYEMQESWRTDEDKCTFIVTHAIPGEADVTAQREIELMIGDVNLFLNDPDDELAAEIDVMIAESSARGKGCGREAVLHIMHYGITKLNLHRFFAKIAMTNIPSQNLFKKLGYVKESECHDFEEITFAFNVGDQQPALEELWLQTKPHYTHYTLPNKV